MVGSKMKNKLRFLIPFIPLVGYITVMLSNSKSWLNKNKTGGYNSPLENIYVFISSAFLQATSINITILLIIKYLK